MADHFIEFLLVLEFQLIKKLWLACFLIRPILDPKFPLIRSSSLILALGVFSKDATLKDNYPLLKMDQMLQKVVIRGNLGSKMGLIRKHANNKFL